MSDTPETDAYVAKLAHDWVLDFGAFDLLLTHARKLEQERDEAREDAKRATYDAAQETIKVSTVKSHWIEACRERDIARESAERYRRKTLSQDANLAEVHRLLDAARESLNAIHVEVGGWIGSMMKGPK
jgi:uncharacterized coiled-coil DUF342 family protein